jgi:hypothetical protein
MALTPWMHDFPSFYLELYVDIVVVGLWPCLTLDCLLMISQCRAIRSLVQCVRVVGIS